MRKLRKYPFTIFVFLAFFMLIIGYLLGNRMKNDNPVEQTLEKIIEDKAYIDIDLSKP